MINKTTVNGFTLVRVHPRMGELERWAVDYKRIHCGYITKAVYRGHVGDKPVIFWFCSHEKKIGYRFFNINKVANCRRDCVKILGEIKFGKKDDANLYL